MRFSRRVALALVFFWSVALAPRAVLAQNYSDSWWNANESGWGITITDHSTDLFVQWYTYDQTGHNQKYVISGGTFANGKCQFSGTLTHVTGPSWTLPTFDPTQVTRTTAGSATINFCPTGLAAGTIVFDYIADGISGSKQLTRLPFGNDLPHWGEQANTGAPDFTDLWWNPSESGWGVSVTQHGNNIFFRIFVYDTDGSPLLFVVPGVTFNSAMSFTGSVQLTSGPWFAIVPFDPTQVVRTTAGTATLTFSDASNGTLNYTVNGVTRSTTITRLLFGQTTPITFYVAPDGKDSWSGMLPAPNSAQTDGPLATFDHARAVVQALDKVGLTRVAVLFRAGTYFLPATQKFTAADSGTASTEIVYQNYPGESPVISGGLRLQNWSNVGGNAWKTTLPASTQYFENLFYNDVRRLRPRLGGDLGTYYRIAAPVYLNAAGPPASAPDPNCSIYVTGSGWECFDRFQYDPTDPITNTWRNLSPPAGNPCGQPAGNPALVGDIELLDFEKFSTSILRINCVDPVRHIVYLTGPTDMNPAFYTALGFIPKHRYLVENVQDQLTQAGQWFLDRSVTPWTLTYLANPGENPNADTVVIPQLTQVLVASNLQYVTFQGLAFAHDNFTVPAAGIHDPSLFSSFSAAVSFQNSRYITFDSGIVKHASGGGLEFISCIDAHSPSWCVSPSASAVTTSNVIQNSAFYDVSYAAVRIGMPTQFGDTEANVPQFTTVQNNVVEGYGRASPDSYGIIQGEGHDNLYTHNDVYDGYHTAIGICICSGYVSNSHDNVFSFNHVYNLFQGLTNDDGALYMQTVDSGTTTPVGNKMRNNRVHDVSDASALDEDGYGGEGIYIDTMSGAIDVENNLVYRVSGSPMTLAGAPATPNEASTIKNNIFAFGRVAMVLDGNPYLNGTVPPSLIQTFVATNNLFYFDRNSASSPAFYVQGGCTYSGGFPYAAWQHWNSNLYWRTDGTFANDPQAFHVQPNPATSTPCAFGSTASTKWTFSTFSGWQMNGEDAQSVVQNPGFKNPAYPADDYSLPNGSPGVGFVVFDPNQAGRSNPVINPPAVPATFPTKLFNPATDF